MKKYDSVVIGGGVLGAFVLRSLRRYDISCILLEASGDIAGGITRANTAIVYTASDNRPGSLKAEMAKRANENFHELCNDLGVRFSRCGSLMVSFGEKGDEVLRKKLIQGEENGVRGMKIISGSEAKMLQPLLSENVTTALYSPMTGTVNPWELTIAAFENAVQNGAQAKMNAKVIDIIPTDEGYEVKTENDVFFAKTVFNCAGLEADKIHSLVSNDWIRLSIDGADFIVFDKYAPKPDMIIFHETENGKGITAVPTVEGNLIVDSPPREADNSFDTTSEGLDYIIENLNKVLPELDTKRIIRSFGALRPNPHKPDGRSIHSFCIENPSPGFYSLIGIKTPGLTCTDEIGKYLAGFAVEYLSAKINEDFDPVRKTGDHIGGEIICLCENITKGEIISAIKRGAKDIHGIKRRTGALMGKCQGSRCSIKIKKILEEYNETL